METAQLEEEQEEGRRRGQGVAAREGREEESGEGAMARRAWASSRRWQRCAPPGPPPGDGDDAYIQRSSCVSGSIRSLLPATRELDGREEAQPEARRRGAAVGG